MEAFASEGWHCIAPDMRGYGGSSAPTLSEAFALNEIVDDMLDLTGDEAVIRKALADLKKSPTAAP